MNSCLKYLVPNMSSTAMNENDQVSSLCEETEFCDESSILLKVAGLYASHLLSDIILVVGENK